MVHARQALHTHIDSFTLGQAMQIKPAYFSNSLIKPARQASSLVSVNLHLSKDEYGLKTCSSRYKENNRSLLSIAKSNE